MRKNVLLLMGVWVLVRGFYKETTILKLEVDMNTYQRHFALIFCVLAIVCVGTVNGYFDGDDLTIGNPDVVESLGTDEYIQWILEDTKAPAASTWRDCFLFITYYDRPESALHAPDECYLGSGYRLASSENIRLNVDCGGTRKEIPARYLVFSSSDSAKSGISLRARMAPRSSKP